MCVYRTLGSEHIDQLLGHNVTIKAGLSRGAKCDLAFTCCKEGVIRAHCNVLTCFDLRASLADDDLTGLNSLTISSLYAEVLWIGITQVFGGTRGCFG